MKPGTVAGEGEKAQYITEVIRSQEISIPVIDAATGLPVVDPRTGKETLVCASISAAAQQQCQVQVLSVVKLEFYQITFSSPGCEDKIQFSTKK